MNRLLLLMALLPFGAVAQKAARPDNYAKTITAADLRRQLFIVAGPEMEGREATSAGERRAAQYIESEFRRIGLEPGNNGSFRQHFPVFQDTLVDAALQINGQTYRLDQDFNAGLASLAATHNFSEAVIVGPGVSNDSLRAMDLAGRLVVTIGNISGRNGVLQSKSPAALLVSGAGFPRTRPAARTGNLTMQKFRRAYGPQTFTISEPLVRTLASASPRDVFAAQGAVVVPVEVSMTVRKETRELQSSNVLGVLPGTDLKDEYLVITAHYDHEGKRGDSVIYYGADDDGSGTVSVIELAEAFARAKKEGRGPRRSIIFMTVSGEEKGLWGSAYYGAHPIFPLEKTTANLNIDMIGRIDPSRKVGDSTNYVYVVGDDKISSDLRPISLTANKKTKLELDYKFNDPNDPNRIYYRSDHYNFARYGVPIIFFFNGTHADYHRPTDTPDKINYPLLAKRAQLVFYTAWDMANRNEMLKRDLPLPALTR